MASRSGVAIIDGQKTICARSAYAWCQSSWKFT